MWWKYQNWRSMNCQSEQCIYKLKSRIEETVKWIRVIVIRLKSPWYTLILLILTEYGIVLYTIPSFKQLIIYTNETWLSNDDSSRQFISMWSKNKCYRNSYRGKVTSEFGVLEIYDNNNSWYWWVFYRLHLILSSQQHYEISCYYQEDSIYSGYNLGARMSGIEFQPLTIVAFGNLFNSVFQFSPL